MTEDLHTYVGLYALDALDGEVLTEFEQHLSTCTSCQQEVREFGATASRLGSTLAVAPPPALRASVLSAIGNVRQEAPAIVTPIRRRPAWFAPFAVAAALVLAFGVLRTVNNRPDAITAESVIKAKDARAVELKGPDGVQTKAYVSAKLDRVALTADGMTPAPAGKSYQLWLIGPNGAESAGIMDPPPGKPAAVLLQGKLSGHQKMSITLEPAGGLPQASGPTLVEGSLT
jgi:anti-sigma-K factor RskA